ncbi:hypothetical protein [Nocardia sp. NPDC057440]|uniref:hypothetical protein n=1 Tax=Nocardia sp. NPDC057440 TaxID=3346134 RepID=UPI00366B00A0
MTQPNQNRSADDLLFGGGAPSVSFRNIGDSIEGTVVVKDTAHKTTFGTRDLEYYEDGSPKLQVVLTLQTTLRDPEKVSDDGQRRLFFPPQMKNELGRVLREMGVKSLPLGTWIRVTHTHQTPSKGQPRKEYKVEVRLPADNAIAEAVSTPAPQVQQAPVTVPTPPAPTPDAATALSGISPELLAVMQQMAQAQQAQK